MQNSQLTKLLLSNSAHEVRTPLNAIINYLEIALEGALDHETRENLLKSHSASKSLIYVINDLLDLTKTEEGQDLIREEIFDLPATVREAASQFENDARRKGLQYQTNEQPGVPQYVQGDQRRVRQAIANITANAIQHTTRGSITIDLWLVELQASTCTVEISIADTGVGMSDDKLDALFRELEQVSSDGAPGILIETKGSSSGQKDDERALGLGLAVVARIIRNMDGQLRLKSAEGEGSRFVIQLTFSMPTEETVLPKPDERSTSAKSQSVVRTPPVTDGEVTLVRKGSASKHDTIARRHSVEEMASLHSFKSAASSSKSKESVKSDVDRLIDALSGPFLSDDDDERRSVGKNSNQSRKSVTSINSIPADRRLINEAGKNMRSASMSTTMYARNQALSGYENVQDSKTPIKAVKMPDEFDDSDMPMHATPSRVNFSIPEPASPRTLDAENLQVLVAEDDPINSRIIRKRLEKCGHVVRHTANGEDCASSYSENCELFDVVLMDMQVGKPILITSPADGFQMPIVDGLTATKMIRSFERIQSPKKLSKRAAIHGRVPIFAVSASLVERERETYINAGFDGWILKPIDFKRVNTLLGGIVDDKLRAECLYSPSLEWEHGGWFSARQPDNVPMASSSSSQKAEDEKSASLPDPRSEQLKRGSVSSVGSVTPTNEPLQSSNVEEATGEEATGDGKSTT